MTTLQDMKKLAEINVESGDARTKSNAKQTLILIEVMERKYEALGEALKAIETLPEDYMIAEALTGSMATREEMIDAA